MLGTLGQHFVGDGVELHIEWLEGVAQGFAALVEAGFDYLHEQPLVASELLCVVACQSDDGALDLGRRVEDVLVDGEEVFDVVEGCQQHAEYAVGLAARACGDALGHFFLEHTHHLGDAVALFEDAEEYLRRNVVGEIAYDGEGLVAKDAFEVEA